MDGKLGAARAPGPNMTPVFLAAKPTVFEPDEEASSSESTLGKISGVSRDIPKRQNSAQHAQRGNRQPRFVSALANKKHSERKLHREQYARGCARVALPHGWAKESHHRNADDTHAPPGIVELDASNEIDRLG